MAEIEGINVLELKQYGVKILLGLHHLHEHGIVHRDLKADNIFLNNENEVKIGDFGEARQLDGKCSQPGALRGETGTYTHMAPEVIKGTTDIRIGRKSDIWSFACVLIEIANRGRMKGFQVNGKTFEPRSLREMASIFAQNAKPIYGMVIFIPLLSSLIDLCLEISEADRPSAADVADHPFFSSVSSVTSECTPTMDYQHDSKLADPKDPCSVLYKNLAFAREALREKLKTATEVFNEGSGLQKEIENSEYSVGEYHLPLYPMYPGESVAKVIAASGRCAAIWRIPLPTEEIERLNILEKHLWIDPDISAVSELPHIDLRYFKRTHLDMDAYIPKKAKDISFTLLQYFEIYEGKAN